MTDSNDRFPSRSRGSAAYVDAEPIHREEYPKPLVLGGLPQLKHNWDRRSENVKAARAEQSKIIEGVDIRDVDHSDKNIQDNIRLQHHPDATHDNVLKDMVHSAQETARDAKDAMKGAADSIKSATSQITSNMSSDVNRSSSSSPSTWSNNDKSSSSSTQTSSSGIVSGLSHMMDTIKKDVSKVMHFETDDSSDPRIARVSDPTPARTSSDNMTSEGTRLHHESHRPLGDDPDAFLIDE